MATNPLLCMFCGHDMTGVDDGTCPECERPVFRFTDRSRAVIAAANEHSLRLLRGTDPDQGSIRWWWPTATPPAVILPCHVVLGIISGPGGVGLHAMLACGADLNALRQRLVRRRPTGRAIVIPDGARLPLHPQTWCVIREAIDQAVSLEHDWVGTEHLLLGSCIRADRTTRRRLLQAGVSHQRARAFIVQNLTSIGGADAAVAAASNSPSLGPKLPDESPP